MAASIPKMRIPFRYSASRLMRMLWRPIWYSALVILWGLARVEAQDAPADRAPIYELHFDDDSLRVMHNEISRALRAETEEDLASARTKAVDRAPSAPRFPFPAVANNQAKKIVWFNADGTIRAQRSFSLQAEDIRVSENGAYVLVVHNKGGEYSSADVELLDAQGTSLWRTGGYAAPRGMSPTGETLVGVGGPETPKLSFWSPQGKVIEYEGKNTLANPVFSADGRFLFGRELVRQSSRTTICLSLFDKQGQRLWQRHCGQGISRVFISETGQFMAYSYYDRDSYIGDTPKRYLAVLDHDGDIVWTQLAGSIYELSFSEEENLIVMLTNKGIVVLNARTGVVQRRFPLPDVYGGTWGGCGVFKLVDDELILGFLRRSREGDFSAHLQVYDPTGVLSWERVLNPETEDWDSPVPVWYQSGSLVGISMGRVFQLFDLSRHDLSEE